MQKLGIRNSMTYRLPNSRKSNFATEPRIVASTVAESPEQDPSQVPALWSHVDWAIDRFIGEGMDDQAPVYAAVMVHSPRASVIIPPRTDAVVSDQAATVPTQRDHHLLA